VTNKNPEDRVVYEPSARATPERQRRALAGLYRQVIERTQRREEEDGARSRHAEPAQQAEREAIEKGPR
jgi:hypothetical protein